MIKLLGINVYKKISWESYSEFGYSIIDCFEIYYLDENEPAYLPKYSVLKLWSSYWSCWSGRTSATRWHKQEFKQFDYLHKLKKNFHYKPHEGDSVEISSLEDIYYFSEDGDDSYYPNWNAYVNKSFLELLKKSKRLKEKKPIYFVVWDSWLGKSYLFNQLNSENSWFWLKVLETDSLEEDILNKFEESSYICSYDIIIIGNKYNNLYSTDELINRLKEIIIKELPKDKIEFNLIEIKSLDL